MEFNEKMPLAIDTCMLLWCANELYMKEHEGAPSQLKYMNSNVNVGGVKKFVQNLQEGNYELYVLPMVLEELSNAYAEIRNKYVLDFLARYCKSVDIDDDYFDEWATKVVALSKAYAQYAGMTTVDEIYGDMCKDKLKPSSKAIKMAQASALGLSFLTNASLDYFGKKLTRAELQEMGVISSDMTREEEKFAISKAIGRKEIRNEIRDKIMSVNDSFDLYYPSMVQGSKILPRPYALTEILLFTQDFATEPNISKPYTPKNVKAELIKRICGNNKDISVQMKGNYFYNDAPINIFDVYERELDVVVK